LGLVVAAVYGDHDGYVCDDLQRVLQRQEIGYFVRQKELDYCFKAVDHYDHCDRNVQGVVERVCFHLLFEIEALSERDVDS